MALFINPEVYHMCTGAGGQTFPIDSQLCVSQILWNGFSAHVKGNGWCLSAPVIWKIQFKRMRERMVHGLFSFPHTERYENDVLLCGGNDANRTAEKFLHNSIQFCLNPNGKLLCQRADERQRQKGRFWRRRRRKSDWRLRLKQWRNRDGRGGDSTTKWRGCGEET